MFTIEPTLFEFHFHANLFSKIFLWTYVLNDLGDYSYGPPLIA